MPPSSNSPPITHQQRSMPYYPHYQHRKPVLSHSTTASMSMPSVPVSSSLFSPSHNTLDATIHPLPAAGTEPPSIKHSSSLRGMASYHPSMVMMPPHNFNRALSSPVLRISPNTSAPQLVSQLPPPAAMHRQDDALTGSATIADSDNADAPSEHTDSSLTSASLSPPVSSMHLASTASADFATMSSSVHAQAPLINRSSVVQNAGLHLTGSPGQAVRLLAENFLDSLNLDESPSQAAMSGFARHDLFQQMQQQGFALENRVLSAQYHQPLHLSTSSGNSNGTSSMMSSSLASALSSSPSSIASPSTYLSSPHQRSPSPTSTSSSNPFTFHNVPFAANAPHIRSSSFAIAPGSSPHAHELSNAPSFAHGRSEPSAIGMLLDRGALHMERKRREVDEMILAMLQQDGAHPQMNLIPHSPSSQSSFSGSQLQQQDTQQQQQQQRPPSAPSSSQKPGFSYSGSQMQMPSPSAQTMAYSNSRPQHHPTSHSSYAHPPFQQRSSPSSMSPPPLLSGSDSITQQLHEDILAFSENCRALQQAQAALRDDLAQRTRRAVKSVWPTAEVDLVGSVAAGVALPKSDLDFVVFFPIAAEQEARPPFTFLAPINNDGHASLEAATSTSSASTSSSSSNSPSSASYFLSSSSSSSTFYGGVSVEQQKQIAHMNALLYRYSSRPPSHGGAATHAAHLVHSHLLAHQTATNSTAVAPPPSLARARPLAPTPAPGSYSGLVYHFAQAGSLIKLLGGRKKSKLLFRSTKIQVFKDINLIRLRDGVFGYSIDLWLPTSSLITLRSQQHTCLIQHYLSVYPSFYPLAMIIKSFMQQQLLNSGYAGLGSYGVLLMIVRFLQCRRQRSDGTQKEGADLDAEIDGNNQNLGKLLCDLFRFYVAFDYATLAIDVRGEGCFAPKPEMASIAAARKANKSSPSPPSSSHEDDEDRDDSGDDAQHDGSAFDEPPMDAATYASLTLVIQDPQDHTNFIICHHRALRNMIQAFLKALSILDPSSPLPTPLPPIATAIAPFLAASGILPSVGSVPLTMTLAQNSLGTPFQRFLDVSAAYAGPAMKECPSAHCQRQNPPTLCPTQNKSCYLCSYMFVKGAGGSSSSAARHRERERDREREREREEREDHRQFASHQQQFAINSGTRLQSQPHFQQHSFNRLMNVNPQLKRSSSSTLATSSSSNHHQQRHARDRDDMQARASSHSHYSAGGGPPASMLFSHSQMHHPQPINSMSMGAPDLRGYHARSHHVSEPTSPLHHRSTPSPPTHAHGEFIGRTSSSHVSNTYSHLHPANSNHYDQHLENGAVFTTSSYNSNNLSMSDLSMHAFKQNRHRASTQPSSPASASLFASRRF